MPQVGRAADADARRSYDAFGPPRACDRFDPQVGVGRHVAPVVAQGQAQRAADEAGTARVLYAVDAADEDGAGPADTLAGDVEATVHPVRLIDIGNAGRP